MENEEIKEIGKYIDSINRPRVRSSKRKRIISIAVVLMIAASFIVSGALLSFYGKIETTATVGQSIQISEDGSSWLDYNDLITRTIPEKGKMIHCTDYCYKAWIRNRACADGKVIFNINWFNDGSPGGDNEGFEINQFLFGETQEIILTQKDVDYLSSPWSPLPEGKSVLLTFNTCGKRFDYTIEYPTELQGGEYTLIYYANYIDDYWQAEGIAFKFQDIVFDDSGTYSNWREAPSMPFATDKMAVDGIGAFENYTHKFGAKFWLVATDLINGDQINWGSEVEMTENVFWETDLGFFMDCRETEPTPLPNVWPLFNLICGDVATLKSEHVYCWITCNHVAMNIKPGIYKYQQIVVPTSI